jgi:hypothetical protein
VQRARADAARELRCVAAQRRQPAHAFGLECKKAAVVALAGTIAERLEPVVARDRRDHGAQTRHFVAAVVVVGDLEQPLCGGPEPAMNLQQHRQMARQYHRVLSALLPGGGDQLLGGATSIVSG